MNTRIVATALIGVARSAPLPAREMPAPTFVLGDRWSYRETDLPTRNETAQLTGTVTAADAAGYWIDARREERTFWLAPPARRGVRHEVRTTLKDHQIFKSEGREPIAFKAGGA